ncbi:MAG: phage portal protein [Bacilli bacterium]|nr:phage portal protein [Methanobrevibacter sp.]MBR1748254.1 phage portal protein [Bacilli bacterium]
MKKGKKSESFIVTVDDAGEFNLIDELELEEYSIKADVDPETGSKQVPNNFYMEGINVLNPKIEPHYLIELLDLNTYHEACVNAVATDASGLTWSLNPVEGEQESEQQKKVAFEFLNNCTPSINRHIYKMNYDRRSLGYGALELIRESTSESLPTRVKHIPAHMLRRHSDEKRVLFQDETGKQVWYVIYGKNYDHQGNKVDVHADTGMFHPYNSLSAEEKANEILWINEYNPGSTYYGRAKICGSILSIKGDLSATRYNISFFENNGMPKFAVTVTGDFIDYDEDPYLEDEEGNQIPNPNYDEKQTLRWKISQQIKEIIKHPHSALCITIPTESEDGNVEIKITPLSVQTEEGHFRMYKQDIRDEIIHAHQVDPARLGIAEAGKLNGTNGEYTQKNYKNGTIAPVKTDAEDLINRVLVEDFEVTSWRFTINELDPKDVKVRQELADFLFARGAMTILDLINNFGEEFGLTVENPDDPYLNSRFINGVPLENVFNQSEQNPYLEEKSILKAMEGNLWPEDDDTVVVDEEEELEIE